MISSLWASRHLAATLTRRQITIRYRQSFAGFFWAIVPSLGMLAVGALVFGRVAGFDSGKEPYAIITMAALVPWNIFANSINAGVPIVYGSSNMVTRLAFPRVALPLSAISTSLVGLAITIAMFLVFAFAFGDGLPWTALWFPLILGLELLFVAGIVLLGSALDVFARDVRLAVPMVVHLWLLATPVMYPLSKVPNEIRNWYLLNPMTGIVHTSRRILVFGQGPILEQLLPAMIGAGVLFIVGAWYFRATEHRFADVV